MWIAIILAVFFCVLWILEKYKMKDFETFKIARENARVYVLEKEAEAERILDEKKREADAYYEQKVTKAEHYLSKRRHEAEDYYRERTSSANQHLEEKTALADAYYKKKIIEAEHYLSKRRHEAEDYYKERTSSANQHLEEKTALADAYYKKKVSEAEHYLTKKKREAEDYYKERTSSANQYLEEKTALADAYYKKKITEADTYYEEKTEVTGQQVKDAETRLSEMQETLRALQAEVDLLSEKTLVELTSIEPYAALSSHEIKNKLALLKTEEDELVKSGEALLITTNGFIQKRILDSRKKQILRCFHAESSMHIGSITAKNVDTIRARLQRSFQTINTLFSANGVQISQGLLALKLEELSLVYAYMLKIEDEKEKKKIIQAQLREEERVRREMEEEKKKIEKEIRQFSAEVKKLMDYMQKSSSDAEKQLYIDKINELEEKLKALNADKEHVLEREQNTRAGFVYIISNIGSFGENIYKIGMTRRLEPMDRISELSSASVPFPFDIHAMIFSEDAPALETLLHRHFADRQVNKVNARKEFFKVDLEEIKQLVLTHHNATVHFVDVPEAAEYRETLQLEAAQSPA